MGIRADPAARSDRTLHLGGAAGDAGGIPRALRILQQAFPPASRADLTRAAQFGGPLCATFPDGQEPLLFCSKYQNETAYDVVLAMLFAALPP